MGSSDLREVRRLEDDELCGYVRATSDGYLAMTVFHGALADFESESDAIRHVTEHGLASLRAHWHYRGGPDEEWQVVLIQEARPGWVRIVLGYYSLPGVPTLDLTPGADDGIELRVAERPEYPST
jgi:hypothetical protein